jgi:hypothetical protein
MTIFIKIIVTREFIENSNGLDYTDSLFYMTFLDLKSYIKTKSKNKNFLKKTKVDW